MVSDDGTSQNGELSADAASGEGSGLALLAALVVLGIAVQTVSTKAGSRT